MASIATRVIALATLVASCNPREPIEAPRNDASPPGDHDSNPEKDASGPALDGDGADDAWADAALDADPSADASVDGALPEAGPPSSECLTCNPPGGQYCGVIGNRCLPRALFCANQCREPGFTCGGGGVSNLCGAARDSGLCSVAACAVPAATYCGLIGDGCGGTLDCGQCSGGLTCGGGGIAGVCGLPADRCPPRMCASGPARYCGVIGNDCGGSVDCGQCPNGETCGGVIPGMCGSDPPPLSPPSPPPVPPRPPAPPRPPPPPPELPAR